MSVSVSHEWIIIYFPGQGIGGREIIRRLMTPGYQFTEFDTRYMGMLFQQRMMKVSRTINERDDVILPSCKDGHQIILKMQATKEMRDMVADFFMGRCNIDALTWGFLTKGEYIKVERDAPGEPSTDDYFCNYFPVFHPPTPPRPTIGDDLLGPNTVAKVHRIHHEITENRRKRREMKRLFEEIEDPQVPSTSSASSSRGPRTPPSPGPLRVQVEDPEDSEVIVEGEQVSHPIPALMEVKRAHFE